MSGIVFKDVFVACEYVICSVILVTAVPSLLQAEVNAGNGELQGAWLVAGTCLLVATSLMVPGTILRD
jgi:hypothetical protein